MNKFIALIAIVTLSASVLAAKSAPPSAPAKPQLTVSAVEPDGSGFQLRAIVEDPAGSDPRFEMLTEEGEVLADLGEGEKEPVNLWVLVDSSTLCRKKNIDERLNKLAAKLKHTLHRDSLVSLVSFTNTTMEIHHNHRSVRDMEASVVACDNSLLSTTYEKPLSHLLAARETSQLPTVIWVYTSGNIDLSAEVMAQLKKRGAEVHIALYNPFVASEIRPVLASTQEVLGKANVRFTVLTPDSPLLPEVRRRVAFSPSYELRGKRVRARLGVHMGEIAASSAPFNLNVPEGNVFLERYLRVALVLLALGIGMWGLSRVYKFYKTKRCAGCGRQVRHNDPGCLFCVCPEDAFLIGAFNHRDKHKLGKADVVRLVSDYNEIGTHRRSVVPVPKSNRKRKACYVTIIREALPKNQYAYHLVRNASDESIQISVNGSPIKKDRYLAAGDVLRIDGVELSFLSGGEESDVA